MKYKIALQKTDEGLSVSVPGLPGCWSQGAPEAEALENIQDAIQEYLAARDDLFLERKPGGIARVITGWDMSTTERRYYGRHGS